jgi:phosphohistidine phosphatase SixA
VIARRRLLAAAAAALAAGIARSRSASALPVALDRPGIVVALRHALAPGIGDPPGFVLQDCTTQRNLDSRGRAQARAIGNALRHAGLGRAAVYASRWCRCLETAELLALGPVIPLPALDSFFREPALRGTRTTALRAFLAVEGALGPPVILVTHQVNISAITGRGTRSGEGVVLRRMSDGGLEELASLLPPVI